MSRQSIFCHEQALEFSASNEKTISEQLDLEQGSGRWLPGTRPSPRWPNAACMKAREGFPHDVAGMFQGGFAALTEWRESRSCGARRGGSFF